MMCVVYNEYLCYNKGRGTLIYSRSIDNIANNVLLQCVANIIIVMFLLLKRLISCDSINIGNPLILVQETVVPNEMGLQ